MSKTRILCHVVFSTHNRHKTLNPECKRDLYGFIYSVFKRHKCWVERINGIADHIHILFDLNPTVSLSDLMKELKGSSSRWLRGNSEFPYFQGWGKGYFAVSVSPESIEKVKEYIILQEAHHKTGNFYEEIAYLIKLYGMEWYPDEWD